MAVGDAGGINRVMRSVVLQARVRFDMIVETQHHVRISRPIALLCYWYDT